MGGPTVAPMIVDEKASDTQETSEGACSDLKVINLSKYYTEFPVESTQLTKLDEAYKFMELQLSKSIDRLKDLESEISCIRESCNKTEILSDT